VVHEKSFSWNLKWRSASLSTTNQMDTASSLRKWGLALCAFVGAGAVFFGASHVAAQVGPASPASSPKASIRSVLRPSDFAVSFDVGELGWDKTEVKTTTRQNLSSLLQNQGIFPNQASLRLFYQLNPNFRSETGLSEGMVVTLPTIYGRGKWDDLRKQGYLATLVVPDDNAIDDSTQVVRAADLSAKRIQTRIQFGETKVPVGTDDRLPLLLSRHGVFPDDVSLRAVFERNPRLLNPDRLRQGDLIVIPEAKRDETWSAAMEKGFLAPLPVRQFQERAMANEVSSLDDFRGKVEALEKGAFTEPMVRQTLLDALAQSKEKAQAIGGSSPKANEELLWISLRYVTNINTAVASITHLKTGISSERVSVVQFLTQELSVLWDWINQGKDESVPVTVHTTKEGQKVPNLRPWWMSERTYQNWTKGGSLPEQLEYLAQIFNEPTTPSHRKLPVADWRIWAARDKDRTWEPVTIMAPVKVRVGMDDLTLEVIK
jgi:hypothetical protein